MRKATLLILLLACAVPTSAQAATSGKDAFATEASLLSQRVREIAAQTPSGSFPVGAGTDLKLQFAKGSDWNSGFLAGALWRVAILSGDPADAVAARNATVEHFGYEDTKLHDLGFMYGESSALGYDTACYASGPVTMRCRSYRRSGLAAAKNLLRLAKSTGQYVIPMSAKTCSHCKRGQTETIVDSMMNLPLLYWASQRAVEPNFPQLAEIHANWVAKHLQRADGSTYQAGRYTRKAINPRIVRHTHQGKNNSGVWARGQAWSLYGFADAAREFRSKKYLAVSQRNANYVATHLPADGVPPWDYRAGITAPRDVSAGVITAAGLFHLVNACKQVKGGCKDRARWDKLARRMLAASLANIRATAPVGYLGGQVYNMRNKTTWDDDAELMFGLDYALEAIALARAS